MKVEKKMTDLFGTKTIEIAVKDQIFSNLEKKTTLIELSCNGQVIQIHCIDEHHCVHLSLKLTQLLIAHSVNPITILPDE